MSSSRIISGAAAESLILQQVSQHTIGIESFLTQLDQQSAFKSLGETLRAIEELINLPMAPNCSQLNYLINGFRLDNLNPRMLVEIRTKLTNKFSADVANRFVFLITLTMAISMAFRMQGFQDAANMFRSVSSARAYFQSRRRHLVTMLYCISNLSKGANSVLSQDSLNHFLPQVEHSGTTLVGLYEKLMLSMVYKDFHLISDQYGFLANYSFDSLEGYFLEPERLSIVEMLKHKAGEIHGLLPTDPKLIFSADEVRNDLTTILFAYEEYNLDQTLFGPVAKFLQDCLLYCLDEYFIEIDIAIFENLYNKHALPVVIKRNLVSSKATYAENLEEFAPFMKVGGTLRSTLPLITRFAYHWKSVCLNRQKKYQIDAGFNYEAMVKSELCKQGFQIQEVKRIERKEFDVVATLNGCIYNVQCKNNLVDLSRLTGDIKLFARYNKRLDKYYANALIKEKNREHLLINKLGTNNIKHIILSRFPVATKNPQILCFNKIKQFKILFVP